MPINPLIGNYLRDSSVPDPVRTNVAHLLDSGKLTPEEAVTGITAKYGNKYNPTTTDIAGGTPTTTGTTTPTAPIQQPTQPATQPQQPFSNWLDSWAQQNGLNQAATNLTNSPVGKALAPVGNAVNQLSSNISTGIQGTDINGKPQTNPLIQGAANAVGAAAQGAIQGVQQAAQGIGQINNTPGSSQITGMLTANPTATLNGPLGAMSSAQQADAATKTGEGLINTAGGTLGAVMAPAAGVVSQIPGAPQIMKPVTDFINGTGQLGSDTLKGILGIAGVQLTPEQSAALDQGSKQLAQLESIKMAQDVAKTTGYDKMVETMRQNALNDPNGMVPGATTPVTNLQLYEATVGQYASQPLAGRIGAPGMELLTNGFNKPSQQSSPLLQPEQSPAPSLGPGAQAVNEGSGLPADLGAQDIKPALLRSNLVSEPNANLLSNLDPYGRQLASDYLDQGAYKLQNPSSGQTMFDTPGREVENFLNKASDIKQQLGQAVSDSKASLSGIEAPMDATNTAFEAMLKKFNVTPSLDASGNMSLDFSNSELAKMGAAQDMLNNIYDKIQNSMVNTGTMDARNMEALTGQMDQASGLLKNAGFKATQVNTAFNQIKSAINGTLEQASPEFGSANQAYAKFIKDFNTIDNAATVKLGNGQDTWSGAQLLRRLTGNAGAKYSAALDAMQNLETNFGGQYDLTAPQELKLKADLANFVEKFTQTNQAGSLSGQAQVAAENAISKIPIAGKIVKGAQAIADYVNPPEVIKANIARLQQILNSGNVGTGISPTGDIPLPGSDSPMLGNNIAGNNPQHTIHQMGDQPLSQSSGDSTNVKPNTTPEPININSPQFNLEGGSQKGISDAELNPPPLKVKPKK